MLKDARDPERLMEVVRRAANEAVARVARELDLPEERIERGSPCHVACQAYAARRERRHFFDPALFADPAWDILLAMYCAHLAGKQLSVSSVVQSTEIPYTTGLRWLVHMEKSGLVSRTPHATDGRVALTELTPLAVEKMQAYLDRLHEKELLRELG